MSCCVFLSLPPCFASGYVCVWETAVVICGGLWVPLLHTWHRSHAWGSSRQCQNKKPDCWLNTLMHSRSLKALECESNSDLLQPTKPGESPEHTRPTSRQRASPDSLNFHFATNLSLHCSDDKERNAGSRVFLRKPTKLLLFLSHLLAAEWYFILENNIMFFSKSSSGRGPWPLLQPATRGQSRCFAFGELFFFILPNMHLILCGPQNVL